MCLVFEARQRSVAAAVRSTPLATKVHSADGPQVTLDSQSYGDNDDIGTTSLDLEDDSYQSDDEIDDIFGIAGRGGVVELQPQMSPAIAPPTFKQCRKIGGAKDFIGHISPMRDEDGKPARYKVGDIVQTQDLRGGWVGTVVVKTDVRTFMGHSLWHYKLKDVDGRLDGEHWFPQTLLNST